MLDSLELTAYRSAVNLPLLNDIIAFIRDASEASPGKRAALRRNCVFLDASAFGGAFQEKYGFLYLGELLERYEERFGMSARDFRAIALALAYAKDLTDDSMFVGPQRRNFLQRVKSGADGDIYLTGALYLLEENPELESKLTEGPASTEELIFAVSLLQNHKEAFQRFKPRLLELLGPRRTMPVIGGMKAMAWLISWLAPQTKTMRGKDTALFRALTALPASHVKPEGRSHEILLSHGYTLLEIAYANIMAVLFQASPDALPQKSIAAQKIAVSLFRELFASEAALSPEGYQQLSEIYSLYARFKPKCCGCDTMLEALKGGPRIQTADTMLWFVRYGDMSHPVLDGFDILDTKWDKLASSMEPEKYLPLFERTLTESLDAAGIQSRIERYDALTGTSYLSKYYGDSYRNCFDLLVRRNIFDLWTCFQNSLDEAGNIKWSRMLNHIRHNLNGLQTIQSFEFYRKFMDAYGVAGLERFFGYDRRDFFSSCTVQSGSRYDNQSAIRLNIQRPFLDEDGQRQLLSWLEAYVYYYKPDKYLPFAAAILQDDAASALYETVELRELFDAIVAQPSLSYNCVSELKRRYWTAEEQQADIKAQAAASLEEEKRQQQAKIQELRDAYDALPDKNFASAAKYLDSYRFYSDKSLWTCRIVREHLDNLLTSCGYTLDGKDASKFLSICASLIRFGAMTFLEAQSYISRLKERVEYAG